MSVKKIITGLALSILLSSGMAAAANQDSMPYKRGDCILAIEPSYSWVNHFARVESYSSIEGFQGENYVLLFLTYQPKAVIFDRSIEENTVKVPSKFCDG
jgi:hypothetical protein